MLATQHHTICNPVTWIKTIAYPQAEGRLLDLYNRVKGPDDNVDNIMLAHSLRPHTMEGHIALYKVVLHHPRNTVAEWFLEAIGVYTSLLNQCSYCVEHHFAGLSRQLYVPPRAKRLRDALARDDFAASFELPEQEALHYAGKLTREPFSMEMDDIKVLREVGWHDGQILEINQVTAYFNYANRTVLGLGVDARGDLLGLSPADTENMDNWQHR